MTEDLAALRDGGGVGSVAGVDRDRRRGVDGVHEDGVDPTGGVDDEARHVLGSVVDVDHVPQVAGVEPHGLHELEGQGRAGPGGLRVGVDVEGVSLGFVWVH